MFHSFSELESYAQSKKNMTFIVKPDNGAQGKGIFLTRNVKVSSVAELILLNKVNLQPLQ